MVTDGGKSSRPVSLSEKGADCYNILARESCVGTRWKQSSEYEWYKM